MTLAHYAGQADTSPTVTPERQLLAELSIGEMLAVLQIAGTAAALRCISIITKDSDGVLQASREAYLRLTVRGLTRRDGERYALTTRGQFLGATLISTIERRAR